MTGPEKIAGAVLLLIGLAVFGVLAFAARKLMGLERAPDVGDAAVLCVFAAFGSLCALGGMAPFPVISALNHFPEDFNRPPVTTPRTVKIHPKEHA